MSYPHRRTYVDPPGGYKCAECGYVTADRSGHPASVGFGADCPVAMREHIATLTATLRDIRAQLDYIAHVGWDASCEAAAADALEAEDATRLNRYAVRVARERDEARAQLATARRTLSALDCRQAGTGVADLSGSHCPLGAPCERCAGERERDRHRDLNLSSLIAFGRLVDRAGPDRPFNIGPPFRAELLRLMDALSGAVEAGIPFDPLDAAMVPPDVARHDDGAPDAD